MKPVETRSIWFKSAIAAAIIGAGVIGFVVLRRFEPNDASWYPKCVFYQLTGLHCPGCGTTRALHSLASGDGWTAVRCNPLLILGLPVIALLLGWQRRRERAGGAVSPRLSRTICAIVIGYFILRNLPSPERSWLSPPSGHELEVGVDE